MERYLKLRFSLVFLFLLFLSSVKYLYSQNNIDIIVQIAKPYSPYYADYFNGTTNTYLLLKNNDQVSHKVKLAGTITGDNGVVISTKKDFIPRAPLILEPFQTISLTGRELRNYLNIDQVDITGVDKEELIRGSALPEGIYDICFQALDYDTGEPLSLPAPSGCGTSEVVFPDAPQLLLPYNGDSVVTRNGTLPVTFTWLPPIPTPLGVKYKLQIAEYFEQSLDPNALLDATTKYYFEKEVQTTTLTCLPNDPPLLDNKAYCWRVVAIDPFGKTQFKNNGKSIAWVFYVKTESFQGDTTTSVSEEKKSEKETGTKNQEPGVAGNSLKILIPNCDVTQSDAKANKYINKLKLNNDEKHYQDLLNKYGSDVPIVEVNNKRDFYILWSIEEPGSLIHRNIKYNIQIQNQSKVIVANFEKSSKFDNLDEAFAFFSASKSVISKYLSHNFKYDVHVDAYDSLNNMIASSNICTFRYIETEDTTTANENIQNYTISGELKYIFQGYENERYPVNLSSFKLKKRFLIKDTVTGDVLAENIPPENFPTYSNLTPNTFDVSLDDKGSFSCEITSLKNGGYVGKVSTYVKDLLKNQTKLISGALYQYFVIDLESPYYAGIPRQIFTNSDIIDLGEIVTKVFSYQLTINIQKKFKNGNFVDLEPEGVRVKVYRLQSKPEIPYYEGDIKITDPKVPTYHIKQVAEVKVQKIVGSDGKPKTIAVIDKLICNQTTGDVYTIDVTQEVIENGVKKTYISDFWLKPFTFKPTPFMMGLSILNQNYNFKTSATATIISNDPPTASLSGKLVYTDPTNPTPNIKPLSNKKIGLMVTYLILNSNGTVSTVIDSAHIVEAIRNKTNDVLHGSNTNPQDEAEFGYQLNHPFKDGNQIIATTYTDGLGNFEFKNFAHLDSTGVWNGSGHFGTGSGGGEFVNIANFTGKVKRTLRVVLVDGSQQYFYSPSTNIDIQPMDSINIGVLTAYTRTYSLTVVPRKNPENKEQFEPGGVVYGSKVAVKRQDLYPSKEDYVKSENGVTFYGLFLHNWQINDDYKIEISTSDTVGDNSYYTRVVNFPRGYNDWLKDTIYANNKSIWVNEGKKGNHSVAAQSQKICQDYESKMESKIQQLYFSDVVVRLFTDDFKLIRDTINIYLDPKAGIISGRVLDATNPMRSVRGGDVYLYTEKPPFMVLTGVRSVSENNQHGYFVFKDLQSDNSTKYRLKIYCPGYHLYQIKTGKDSTSKTADGDYGDYIPPLNDSGMTVRIGQHWFFPQILMMPNGTIKGYVVNESGKAVEAYLRTTTSKMYKTQPVLTYNPLAVKQTFSFNIPTNYYDTLYVIPVDLKYFPDTIPIPKLSDNAAEYDFGAIVVKERLHKIRLHILDAAQHAIPNVRIELLDYVKYTGPLAPTFVFKNASLKNFWLKIIPDTNTNFIPKSIEITNEETKDFVDYYITLNEGYELIGKVTSGGKPLQNAMVYVINGNTVKKTYTNANGEYDLKGIRATEVSQVYYQEQANNQKVAKTLQAKVYFVPPDSPDGDYLIGEEKTIIFNHPKEKLNIDLQTFTQANLRKFYGFDVKITKIVNVGSNRYKINGVIDLSKSQNTFELIDKDQNISFSNILVQPSLEYKDPNGVPYFEDVGSGGDYIPLDLPSMKVRYYGYNADGTKNSNFYNVLLEPINLNYGSNNTFILLRKETPIKGSIYSLARIVDNSFNFPGSYFRFEDNQFYLAQDNNGSYTRNVKSFSPGEPDKTKNLTPYQIKLNAKFHLCNSQGFPLSFKFLEFNASSEVKDSKLGVNGVIELLPVASTNLRLDPQSNKTTYISFKMPVLKLTSDSIFSTGNINKIEVQLEQWTLVANNCEVSPDVGGLLTTDAMIKTGSFDIPIKYFNLRADFLFVDKVELNNLKLGNGKKLVVKVQNPQFGIDPYCGLDLKPHFKLTIVGEPAAEVTGLPGFGNNPLQFQAVSLLSNGEKIISFAPNCQKISFYNVADFKPLTISNYDDAFFLEGLLDLNIPRVQNGLSAKLKFQKINNKDTVIVMPGDISFEGPGYVKFLSKMNFDKQIFSQGYLQLYGKVWEDGKLNPIDVVLQKIQWGGSVIHIMKSPDKIIQYFPSETVPMDARYLIDSARMDVKSGDWTLLKLKLNPTSEMAAKGYGSEPLRLVVYGEIKTDPEARNEIAVKNVPVPFGDFSLTFDYPNLRLFGTINIPKTQVGSITFNGAAEICIDKNGFYMASTGKGVIDVVGGFAAGILIGNYAGGNSNGYKSGIPESAYNLVTANSIGKGLPCAFEDSSSFEGFFVTGRISAPIVTLNKEFDLVIVTAHLVTEAGLEASGWASFNKPMTLGLSAISYVTAELGISAITCTELDAKATLAYKGEVSYTEGNDVTLSASAGLKIYGLLEQKVPTLGGCGPTIFKLGSDNKPLVSLMATILIEKDPGINTTGSVKYYLGTGDVEKACSIVLTK